MTTQLFNYHIIKIDSVYDKRPTETGLTRLNEAHYREEKEMDRYERKLLTGTIYQVPLGYSEENFMPIDPGIPNYKTFIGHDHIQLQRNYGRDWGNEKYHPGLVDKIDFETIADYGAKIDAQIGEKVYFHPSVTEGENHLEGELYKCAVHEIIAVVRDGRMVPQGGYVLVTPHKDTNLVSDTGLVVAIDAEFKLLEGTVAYARQGADVKAGDSILFQDASDWKLLLEGEELYAMREEDIWMRKA